MTVGKASRVGSSTLTCQKKCNIQFGLDMTELPFVAGGGAVSGNLTGSAASGNTLICSANNELTQNEGRL